MAQKNSNMVAIITMCAVFAMISFVTNMAAPFGNLWSFQYEGAGMWGNLMNFTAYLFMGIPAGNMLIKYGYKKTTLIALAVGVIGLAIQYLSSLVGAGIPVIGDYCLNLFIYLLGALVCGFCVCMLNTVVNPMLNLLGGGGNKGNQYIQIGGTLNSVTGSLTPFVAGALVGTVTKDTSMGDVAPLVLIGIAIFAAAFIIIANIKIVEPQGDLSNVVYEKSPIAFRHCLLGIIAIFFYVGIEIGIPGEMNAWISRLPFEGAATVAGTLATCYWLLMMVGRFASTFISKWVSSRVQMITVSAVAIAFLLAAISTGSVEIAIFGGNVPLSCVFIFLCGLCTSVMWGAIFNLATEGLGKYTAKASGLFMTMVVGGGVMPVIQDKIATTTGNYLASYWVIIAMLAYILYYALIGCKNVNKDIKID